MSDPSALLGQLRIDRGAPEEPSSHRWWWLAALVLVLAAAGAGWWVLGHRAVPVRIVVARGSAGGAAGGGSLLDASGYVVARRQATVSAKTTGKVVEVLIEEGQHVDKGQIVGRLDDTNVRAQHDQAVAQLGYARASLAQVRVQLGNAERELVRSKGLVKNHYISVAALDTAQTTRDNLAAQVVTAERNVDVAQQGVSVTQRALDDTVIRAPFSGVITVKAAQPGEIVSPISAGGGFTRTGIGTIVDMDSLEIEVDVNENFINRVHPDQPVNARLNAYPDWNIPAHVIAVIPTADRSKATVKVRVGLEQKDARVLPDMGARVSFLSEAAPANADAAAAKPGIVVPPEAVQPGSGEGTGVVWIVKGETVERRAVRLGQKTPDGQLLQSGVAAGERLAISGGAPLQDGMHIAPAGE